MTNEVLRLKNDVLNELRNEKYYTQDDLRIIVDNASLSQREKVRAVIDRVSSLVRIDENIATVESIFQTPAEPQGVTPPTNIVEPQGVTPPTNIVEESQLNTQGQTHSE